MSGVSYPDLREKVVMVTGGASNIGRGMVLAFADQGARLVVVDVDVKQAERTAQEIRARGAEITVVSGDLSRPEVIQEAVETAVSAFGRIDVLVNNLGWQRPAWFGDLDPATIDRTIALNLRVTIDMCQAVLPVMVSQRSGSLINISSDAAFGDLRQSVYGATKAAIISLTKSLAKEAGRSGVRANVVAPGLVLPPGREWVGDKSLWAGDEPVFDERGRQAVLKGIPLRRFSEPEDIAASVLFFASDLAARQLTGQVISVSGGYAMPC
ncbi:SDR family NAD(P)-dependent oxidoreductase [Micromonospora globispora]|uniref:SDR family NAD(P)-dependent oxidoreductase n=1 Tax=Micromonospora globispora TaxID=1450148 RepID=UPI000F4E4E9A|nr:SDR family NAD(P)-dependent oxidoreductase [Micromonospora globispora]